jgi:hypothetical protein
MDVKLRRKLHESIAGDDSPRNDILESNSRGHYCTADSAICQKAFFAGFAVPSFI